MPNSRAVQAVHELMQEVRALENAHALAPVLNVLEAKLRLLEESEQHSAAIVREEMGPKEALRAIVEFVQAALKPSSVLVHPPIFYYLEWEPYKTILDGLHKVIENLEESELEEKEI